MHFFRNIAQRNRIAGKALDQIHVDINILPTTVGALNDFLQIEYIAAQQEDDFTRACKRCLQRVGILHRGDDRAARELIIELLFHIHPIPFHSIEGTIKIY